MLKIIQKGNNAVTVQEPQFAKNPNETKQKLYAGIVSKGELRTTGFLFSFLTSSLRIQHPCIFPDSLSIVRDSNEAESTGGESEDTLDVMPFTVISFNHSFKNKYINHVSLSYYSSNFQLFYKQHKPSISVSKTSTTS